MLCSLHSDGKKTVGKIKIFLQYLAVYFLCVAHRILLVFELNLLLRILCFVDKPLILCVIDINFSSLFFIFMPPPPIHWPLKTLCFRPVRPYVRACLRARRMHPPTGLPPTSLFCIFCASWLPSAIAHVKIAYRVVSYCRMILQWRLDTMAGDRCALVVCCRFLAAGEP